MKLIREIVCISILLFSLNIYAGDAYNCVVLETIKGEMMEFSLSSKPYMIQKSDTIIMMNDEEEVEVIMADIKKIYFSSSTINSINKSALAKGMIRLQQGCVYLSGFIPGEYVVVYNMAGQQFLRRVITSQGTVIINYSDIPQGIAIIKSNQRSYKIIIR